ncbi:MAG: hypothetical protein Q7S83_02090 [bacterium]|nr:hypothetical protein [bacterium]
MHKLSVIVFACFYGGSLFAEVADFEKPPSRMKARITEYWDEDDKNPTVQYFDRKVTETFDDRGDLVNKELSDSTGKTEKLIYKHIYGDDGQIKERLEIDDKGKTLERWTYKRDVDGNLEIEQRIILATGDLLYISRFDKKGLLKEWECAQCRGSKTKIVNHYSDDGVLKKSEEVIEGKIRNTTDFEYDKDGKLRRATTVNHMGYLSAESSYNLAGDLEERAVYDYYGGEVVAKLAHEYTYDKDGRITEDEWMDSKIEKRALALKRGHVLYQYEFYEKK